MRRPKIIGICMEVNSIIISNDYDILGAVLTHLKQKKIKNYRFDFEKI